MSIVILKDLSKKYADITAVSDFNLTVENKEFVVLVGPSGCGKTTTLRMIAGLEDITSGTVEINGKVINNVHPKDRDIAMVFQNYALYPHMNVFKNISFGLRARKFSKSDIEYHTLKAAEILDLTDLLERKPGELSGGQKQRVAMGRAIVREPKLFLFDEPLSNLDAKLRHKMRAEIKKLQQTVQTTSIYVTHDQIEAMTLADRIVIMRNGLIEQVGTPFEVYHQPENSFVAGFIGSPAMNFLECKLNGTPDGFNCTLKGGSSILLQNIELETELYEGQKSVLGIRPEYLIHGSADSEQSISLTAQLEVVEPLGAETLLLCKGEYGEITGKTDHGKGLKWGNTIQFHVDPLKIHIFDEASGKRISKSFE